MEMLIKNMPNVEIASTVYPPEKEKELWYNYVTYRVFSEDTKPSNDEMNRAMKSINQFIKDRYKGFEGFHHTCYSSDLYRREGKNQIHIWLKVIAL